MSSNDQNKVLEWMKTKGINKATTTVLPNSWIFNRVGNTLLKRKRKHKTSVSKEDKNVEWMQHCCSFWGVKLNRETKIRLIEQLKNTSKEEIEKNIKRRKNDGQKS